MSRTYSISELSQEFGVTARTIRFYEDEGLVAPARRGRMRVYSARDRARLSIILRGKRVGFSLSEIREMLDLYDLKDGGIAQTLYARRKFEERIAALERQKSDIEESLAELRLGLAAIENRLSETGENERAAARVRLIGYGVQPADN